MRGQLPLRVARSAQAAAQRPAFVCRQCRSIQVSAVPTTETRKAGDAFGGAIGSAGDTADARFEVIGSPYSLLSVNLSASQNLYTRRGTLVAVVGKPENAQSTLSLLNPLTRPFLGMPFLYQRISSTSPITALISTKSATTTFTVLHLDGTTDWMVTQRPALLAWTGHNLHASPRIQYGLSAAHWGNTLLTGRGLAALSAPGQTYQVILGEGEEFVAHPSHVVAYTVTKNPPLPMRLRSSVLRFEIPGTGWFKNINFVKGMRESEAYKVAAKVFFWLRTSARRSIFGDRLFLHFRGPTTLLMSSRGVRVADVLSRDEVNEIADTEAGVVPKAIELATTPKVEEEKPRAKEVPTAIHVANVGRDGKVTLEDAKDLKEFVR